MDNKNLNQIAINIIDQHLVGLNWYEVERVLSYLNIILPFSAKITK